MTLKQVLTFDVNRILHFDVNRILKWDVGAALTRPVTNPLLKGVCGSVLGIAVFGFGGMMVGAVMGMRPNEDVVRLLALGLGVVFAMTPNTSRRRSDNVPTERPVV